MDLKKILSISGQSGLYKLVSQARNGIIVESLDTGKRMPAYATSKISALEDISIFCEEEDLPLVEVFKKIHAKENGGSAISHKEENEKLKKYFLEVLPNYDRDRVYVSDIKRVLNWYNILHSLNLVEFNETEEVAETQEVTEAKEVTEAEEIKKEEEKAKE